jgi:transaldolase
VIEMPGRGDSRIAQLHDLGQSPWFDYISRELIARGGLKRMVDRDGLGGVTSNQAIFENAMRSGSAYDEQILELARQGLSSAEIVDRIAIEDVRAACDVLAPVYLRSGGEDGFVSIAVSPAHAYDAEKSVAEAERLFAAVDRPNAMIKIPGTREGVPAILESLRRGLNIDITLLFSLSQYEAVAGAYLDALEYRLQRDLTIRAVSSVASFFVSRVDTHVDALLEAHMEGLEGAERRKFAELRGRAGVANAKIVYERFRTYLNSRPWQLIAASGAKVQRVLWASTGTKNPEYSDVLYVDELIGEHTVNTLTEATWKAFKDHGSLHRSVDRHLEDSHRTLRDLSHLGIDIERAGVQLQTEGVDLFMESFEATVANVERKRQDLLAGVGG